MINDFFQRAKVQRKVKGRKRYTLNNVNRQKRLRHECLKTKHLDFVTRYSVTVLKTKTGTRPPMASSPMALNEYFSSNNMDNWNKCITFAA